MVVSGGRDGHPFLLLVPERLACQRFDDVLAVPRRRRQLAFGVRILQRGYQLPELVLEHRSHRASVRRFAALPGRTGQADLLADCRPRQCDHAYCRAELAVLGEAAGEHRRLDHPLGYAPGVRRDGDRHRQLVVF